MIQIANQDALEQTVERLVKATWAWGQSCGVDDVAFDEQGDTHNEMLRAQADQAKDDLYTLLRTALCGFQEPELHAHIMNLPCAVPDELLGDNYAVVQQRVVYKEGHRDARRAAAALVQRYLVAL